jgi:hypothetical protein
VVTSIKLSSFAAATSTTRNEWVTVVLVIEVFVSTPFVLFDAVNDDDDGVVKSSTLLFDFPVDEANDDRGRGDDVDDDVKFSSQLFC